jgi:prepilin-type N-terminal cleavage/methylation domain-containing protein
MLRRPGVTARPEAGFTLVELLISIAVLGILIAGVVSAMLAAITTDRSTDVRLSESRDLQLVSSYLSDDAAGAQSFATAATPRCGTDPSAVVEFRGQSFDASTLARSFVVTSYVLRSATLDGRPTQVLHRLTCASAASSPSYPLTPTADVTLARLLSTTVSPTTSCTDRAAATITCGNSGAVTLALGLTSRSGDVTSTLTGHRRTA